jgi:ubiquitin carboxyl-terminal hydrolase 15
MHNEMNRVSKKPRYGQIDCDKKPMIEQSEIWFRYFRDRDNSIITDLFEGQLCSKIECQKCGYKSLSFDNFMDLSISIPSSSSSVEKCLQNFIKPEKMEKCGYKCS